jgi:hypothetical protein
VVLVAMSQHTANHSIKFVLEIPKIREDNVNPGLGFLWKQNTTVNNQDLVV